MTSDSASASSPQGATEGTSYHHGDLRRTLVAAALALLTETQDWGFSLREVARRAGVSHAAPYNHFSSKHDLLAAVAAAGYDLLRLQMQEAAAYTSAPALALQAIGTAYVRFGAENPAHYRLMFGTTLTAGKTDRKANLSPAESILWESGMAAKAVLRGVIRQGAENGSFAVDPASTEAIDIAVLSTWSLVHGLTQLLIDGRADVSPPSQDPQEVLATAAGSIAQRVTHLLLHGLRASH